MNVDDIESDTDNHALNMDGLKPLADEIQFNVFGIEPAMGYMRVIFTDIHLVAGYILPAIFLGLIFLTNETLSVPGARFKF